MRFSTELLPLPSTSNRVKYDRGRRLCSVGSRIQGPTHSRHATRVELPFQPCNELVLSWSFMCSLHVLAPLPGSLLSPSPPHSFSIANIQLTCPPLQAASLELPEVGLTVSLLFFHGILYKSCSVINRHHLLNAYYMPITVLGILHINISSS